MKITKILVFMAALLFLLSAIGTFSQVWQLHAVAEAASAGSGRYMIFVPVVEIFFAFGCFSFGYYLVRQERKGLVVLSARFAGITLLILSIVIPWSLMVWFVLMPIYNLSAVSQSPVAEKCERSSCWGHLGCNYYTCTNATSTYIKFVN